MWRSLDELANTPEFRELIERQFPQQASQMTSHTSRRRFLQLMGASLALAGLNTGCERSPNEKIVPYVQMPEYIVPGKPLYFATAMAFNGAAIGLLVESHMGRPTKIEGNPLHPASPGSDTIPEARQRIRQRNWDQPDISGATDIFAQAAVLGLYDPDRSQVVIREGQISTYEEFARTLTVQTANRNIRLRVLTETVVSPTLAAQLEELLAAYPNAQWHQWEPVLHDNVYEGTRLAFGRVLQPVHDFSRAAAILSLDANFLAHGPGHLVNAHQFIARRKLEKSNPQATMNRLYVAETSFTITGAKADHRLALQSAEVEALARAVASRLGIRVGEPDERLLEHVPPEWLDAVVDDLQNYRTGENSASLVVAGMQQPPVVHALAHAINERLGNIGTTVRYIEPAVANPESQLESLANLIEAMRSGEVEMLLILGGNPVFNSPADFEFADALQGVPFRIHLSGEYNETTQLCDWHIPELHFLESWSDARAFDGTVAIVQPLIAPLYIGTTAHQLISTLIGRPQLTSYDIVKAYWRSQYDAGDFEEYWQTSLHNGVLEGTAFVPVTDVALQTEQLQRAFAEPSAAVADSDAVELVFEPDPSIWDGRFANNSWLQELPKPLTKLTWDNAALMSIDLAQKLGVRTQDMVEIQLGRRSLRMPVLMVPGLPRNSITLHFGHGRRVVGAVGKGTGFNVYTLRTSEEPWIASRGSVRPVGGTYPLAMTQQHHLMGDPSIDVGERPIVIHGTLDTYLEHPEEPAFMHAAHKGEHPSLYPEYEYDGYKWGMSIDQTACIGCNACVIACQAENNVPVVGKVEVERAREMHWLRIDTYFDGGPDEPEAYHQPVPCMHCEKAPCEVVCPVSATVHSDEGLNDMVYNRCVGTRYCSNNCPYKVRRFNFFQYTDWNTESYMLQRNPDVTVRSRGVMEKCTYCVQRISAGRIAAQTRDAPLQDGEVVTACQAACPTEAIIFGDLNDVNSRVAKLRADPLNYALLAELNTQPRTTYMAAVRNPHPSLKRHEETPHASH